MIIRDLINGIVDNRGKTPPLSESGHELIETPSLVGDYKYPDFEKVGKFVSDETFNNWFRSGHPQKGDILISTVGVNIGSLAIVSENKGCIAQNIVGLRPNPQMVDSDYFFYVLNGPYMQRLFKNIDIGGAQPSLKVPHILDAELPFELPTLSDQHRIAKILTPYDDLIENNRRRIKILEEIAQSLYREWFVHFRYPGHESIPLVNSPLGPIPKGWVVKTVGDSFEIQGGGTPSRKVPEYWEGGAINWYSPSDLTASDTMFMDGSSDLITPKGLSESSAKLFPAYSVMMTSRATIGAIAINTSEACTNQGFITCLPNNDVPLYFLFHWLKENTNIFLNMASGATFKEISRGVFNTIEFIQPQNGIVESFDDHVKPIAGQILVLQRQIQNLRQTRDLLLPRLLSDKIPSKKRFPSS